MHRTVSVSIKQPLRLKSLFFFALSVPVLFSQAEIPEWCRALPRPEYKVLQRVPISDPWFEVYKVPPAVFAIYEPHQSEEVISYLVGGDKRAALFDTFIAVPVRTQDATALFASHSGLFLTGDIYFPSSIWLYCPGNDLEACST